MQDEEHKLSLPTPPIEVLHSITLAYLQAGPHYDWAYRAAFLHEDRKNIADLKVKTSIFRWDGSILKKYTDRIFDANLDDNISSIKIDKEASRFEKICDHIKKTYSGAEKSIDWSKWSDLSDEVKPKLDVDLLPSFPSPTYSGTYLVDAWQTIAKTYQDLTPQERQEILIAWAKI